MRNILSIAINKVIEIDKLVTVDRRKTEKIIKDYESGDCNAEDLLELAIERLKDQNKIIHELYNLDEYADKLTLEEVAEYYDIKQKRFPKFFGFDDKMRDYLNELIELRIFKSKVIEGIQHMGFLNK